LRLASRLHGLIAPAGTSAQDPLHKITQGILGPQASSVATSDGIGAKALRPSTPFLAGGGNQAKVAIIKSSQALGLQVEPQIGTQRSELVTKCPSPSFMRLIFTSEARLQAWH
jgi:hypothetical protein